MPVTSDWPRTVTFVGETSQTSPVKSQFQRGDCPERSSWVGVASEGCVLFVLPKLCGCDSEEAGLVRCINCVFR